MEYKQIRITKEVYDELVRIKEGTGIPLIRLITKAVFVLKTKLKVDVKR